MTGSAANRIACIGAGYWRVAVLEKHRRPASIRQLVPAGFFLLMLVLFVFGLCLPSGSWLVAAALPLAYVSMLITAGVGVAIKQDNHVGLVFPIAASIMHFAYAAGFGWGLLSGKNQRTSSESSPKGLPHVPRI